LRALLVICACAAILLSLGSCGAAATALQDQFVEQVRGNQPSGSVKPTAKPSAPAPAPAKVDVTIAAMLAQHNQLRKSKGLAQLTINGTLSQVAQRQAVYNASVNKLAHTDASGGQVWDRADAAGYSWSTIGENLAFSTNPPRIFNLWVNSPGHFQNMVNPAFNECGMGKVASDGGEYWCVVFARR
jgi:uncharacterized protein YkwD